MNPPAISSSVTRMCWCKGRPPRLLARGSTSHVHTRARKTDGCEKKKVSIQPARAPSSQTPAPSRKIPACSVRMAALLSPARGRTGQDLLRQVAPDAGVDLREARDEPRLQDVARPRQVDGVVPLDARRRAGAEDHDAVGHGDGLL